MSKKKKAAAEQKLRGLAASVVQERQKKFGQNIISREAKIGPLKLFLRKFTSPLILILIGATVISLIVGEHKEAIIILVMVLASCILDFLNSRKSEKAMERLAERVAIKATVVRAGQRAEVLTRDLVPGDIVLLAAGDVVPADAVIILANDFFVNQAALTGESFPIEKRPVAQKSLRKKNSESEEEEVYMGSSVVTGFSTVEITKTGMSTKFGQIAAQLSKAEPETDFEKGIKKFSFLILQIISALVIVVFFANTLLHKGIFESFIFSLAVAIGLTPELLPVVMSVALSHGSMLMSKKDVIVKNHSAIENFGGMNILCTDKTGTLTEDKIILVKYVNGFGETDEKVLFYSYLNSFFHTGVKNPLDTAIQEFKHLNISGYKKIDEMPFDYARRKASIVVADKNGRKVIITKGAPEDIFGVCETYLRCGEEHVLDAEAKARIQEQYDEYSGDGYRVLAVSHRRFEKRNLKQNEFDERDMTLLGFMAFFDPPKQTAPQAIRELEKLGIEIKIITGDSELLTEKICRDIGLSIKGVVLGKDIDKMSEEKLKRIVLGSTVFARVNPAQKERIILSIKKAGGVVGYLGDGINDAPALKAADVGISVDNAVDVAKETADIVLLRKSLHVLKDGVLEGRKTFQNTMKYIMMGLSSNFGNMFSMTGLSIILPFFPMLPAQILLNNLLYDFSQFTIPTDSVDEEDTRRPLRWDMDFIKKFMIAFGPISSIFDFLTFGVMWYFFHPATAQFQAAWFIESLATQTFVVYVIRTKKFPFIKSTPSKPLLFSTLFVVLAGWLIPFTYFGGLIGFSPLSPLMLAAVIGLVLFYLFLVQIAKTFFYRRSLRLATGQGKY